MLSHISREESLGFRRWTKITRAEILDYPQRGIVLYRAAVRKKKRAKGREGGRGRKEARKRARAFNFLATLRRSAASSFPSSASFFSCEAQIDGGKKHSRKRNADGPYISPRCGFVKRFASLTAACFRR